MTPVQLNRAITEIPQETAIVERRKATLYNLASKVALIAFAAIAAGVLLMSLGILSPMPSTLLLPLLLSTIPLQIAFQKWMILSYACSHKAKVASDKAAELAKIQNWKRPEIEAFFKEHKLSLNKFPTERLQVLLPAIASFFYSQNLARELYKQHQDNLANTHSNRVLQLEGRRAGWKLLEQQAIPEALRAAALLEVIQNPFSPTSLDDIGSCRAKEFDERRFDQLIDGNDAYFVFKDAKRPSLTFTEVQHLVATMDLDRVRLKIFSKSEQSRPALRL